MAYLIGRLVPPFLIAFCLVYFLLKKSYFKKHGKEMSTGGVIGRTLGFGLLISLVSLVGQFS